ncbi:MULTISPECIES: hypothetical protein [Pseudomonas]|uniref:Uncharacterized protein n=2 Tax=Pseudomonas syringae TaxID=317 RepID=A0AAD0I845_PSESX|nr:MULTISPECIES: hypothetical protein [Pseudomonas]KEZ74376.1 hypothetical protein C5I_0107270 [Pseudomonas syringae pv. syringae FF5]AVX22584.1 hypothetical protein DA456_03765 [Pseudomonas syringae pv. atrofaciens]KFE47764.1 hypothetical protein IV03_06755 [Pseudomonas congelans]KPW12733.1 hypothetical protein ALO42_101937 [Pseudomonas syringae pv. atrofaciens]KPZ03272.1 hypothetical protein ALO85_101284 [Pseudomonas syringae pv. aptata]
MDHKTNFLLSNIPEGADYAADAGDLDLEDIPQERMEAVIDLLRNTDDEVVKFLAAKLLASWGVFEGFSVLKEFVEKKSAIITNIYPHRLHGYDDTFRQVLMAVVMFYANMAGAGKKDVARAEVYPLLSKIIELAASNPFEITDVLSFIKREQYFEYLPLIKGYLMSIIDKPEVHRWKIYDAIEFLVGFDSQFVVSLLEERRKSIEDFKPSIPG